MEQKCIIWSFQGLLKLYTPVPLHNRIEPGAHKYRMCIITITSTPIQDNAKDMHQGEVVMPSKPCSNLVLVNTSTTNQRKAL